MPSALEILFPLPATNDYRGSRYPLAAFYILLATKVFSSSVHLFKDDSGVNSIATIIVFPFNGAADPNNIIYMFSAVGGVTQMMFTLLYLLVLWRYRSLIPLMLCFMLLESLLGLVATGLHPLTPEYFEQTPPALAARLPKLILLPVLAAWAIRSSRSNWPQEAS